MAQLEYRCNWTSPTQTCTWPPSQVNLNGLSQGCLDIMAKEIGTIVREEKTTGLIIRQEDFPNWPAVN